MVLLLPPALPVLAPVPAATILYPLAPEAPGAMGMGRPGVRIPKSSGSASSVSAVHRCDAINRCRFSLMWEEKVVFYMEALVTVEREKWWSRCALGKEGEVASLAYRAWLLKVEQHF